MTRFRINSTRGCSGLMEVKPLIEKRFKKYCLNNDREHIDILMEGYLDALYDMGLIDAEERFMSEFSHSDLFQKSQNDLEDWYDEQEE